MQVTITALDKDDEFLNFLNMGGNVVGPDMKPIDLKIQQTAPGRYVGEFDAKDSGSYFMSVSPGPGLSPILTGVNVPYSAEYLDREPNDGLLKDLAALEPKGSERGVLIEDEQGNIEQLLEHDTFRHNLIKATSSQDIWHLLLLFGGCLFFADVFNRRVTVDLSWAKPHVARLRDKILRREPAPAPTCGSSDCAAARRQVAQQSTRSAQQCVSSRRRMRR